MDQTHIVTRFDKDLNDIETLIVDMSDKVALQIINAAKALEKNDETLAKTVAQTDAVINQLEEKIDEKAIRLIALRQPMAEDLRSAITTLKISANLERMGDYAKILCYRIHEINDFTAIKPVLRNIIDISEKIANMLNLVMDAYVNRNLKKAHIAIEADKEINERTNALFRELLTYMMENPRNIEPCTHLLFISKNLERSGDQITNIAEQIHYLITGTSLES